MYIGLNFTEHPHEIWSNIVLTYLHQFDPENPLDMVLPIGSMYAIYGNIYHQYTPVMLA